MTTSHPLLQHRLPPLSKAEQLVLITKAQAGDARAESALLQSQLPWVMQRIRYWGRSSLKETPDCLDDLLQEGCLGFLKAVRQYDQTVVGAEGFGPSLISYADKCIRTKLFLWRQQQQPVKTATAVRGVRLAAAVKAARGEALTPTEQADLDRYTLLKKARQPASSLNKRVESAYDDSSLLLQDLLVDDQAVVAETALAAHQAGVLDHARLTKALGHLPDERDREIFRLRYLRSPPLTLTTLGALWGLSRERIRQLEAMALRTILPRLGWPGSLKAFMKAWRVQGGLAEGDEEPLPQLRPDQVGRRPQAKPRHKYTLSGPQCDQQCGRTTRAGKDGVLKTTCHECLLLRAKVEKVKLRALKKAEAETARQVVHQQLDEVLRRQR